MLGESQNLSFLSSLDVVSELVVFYYIFTEYMETHLTFSWRQAGPGMLLVVRPA